MQHNKNALNFTVRKFRKQLKILIEMKNNFNGFASQEAYEEALEILTDIRENNDIYCRDITSVTKKEDCVELVIDDYSIQIWDEDVELYILNGKERLVDCGIMNVCSAIREGLLDGSIDFFNE